MADRAPVSAAGDMDSGLCQGFARLLKKISLFSAVLYIAYQIGLTQMYLFSMPAEEAAVLSESIRYSKSIIIAVIYILLILAMKTVSEMNTEKTGPLVLVSAAAAASFFGFDFFQPEK